MADIINYNSVSIQKLMDNLELYKYNPSAMQRVILEHLDAVTNGEVDIVDPTNPFVFLLESSTVNTALAIQENLVNLRKQYSSLAQTTEELYLHLSDKDFINRFATPSSTTFTFAIQVNDLMNKMISAPAEDCTKAIIPRDSEFRIDDMVFTLQYPIEIRKFTNGVVQISYDATIESPLETLTTNIIDYVVRRDLSQVDWIFFKVPVQQFSIVSSYYSIQNSSVFSYNVNYTDSYYYARVFYRNTATGNLWSELVTTHTDQVFDPFTPTAVLKVLDGQINVFIPTIYITSGLVSGDIRIDIYSTKGELTVNLSNYKLNSFLTILKAIDEERDISVYSNIMSDISYYTYSDQMVSGGKAAIDFETLRNRVIFNSEGVRQLPITNAQIESYVNDKGFELVKNVDVITNRIFLATQKLPRPLNDKLITSANIGISSVVLNLDYLKTLSTVSDNGNRITILSKNLYRNNNGQVAIVPDSQVQSLLNLPKLNLVSEVNSKDYLYSPFYYVLDNTYTEFELRAYDLDYPVSSDLSFISQNQTLQLPVNTGSYVLSKIADGYRLTIVTKSGNFYKQLGDNLVDMQLGFYPTGENTLAYINGTLEYKTPDDERVYSFDIKTNYDLDTNNLLCITNAKMFIDENINTWIDLSTEFHLIYTTSSITSNYIPDVTDSFVGKFLLPDNSAGVTHESLVLKFGYALKNLWTRSRTFASGLDYLKYTTDIPLLYTEDIYQRDPVTNSIFSVDEQGNIVYNIIHHKDEPVLDGNGAVVYKHRKGDVVLDAEDKPVIADALTSDREIDMLFVDGKYFFVTDKAFIDYKAELTSILDTWITANISDIQDLLLEQTKIFFYPKTTLSLVKVYPNSETEDLIASQQSLIVNLYVKKDVFSNTAIKAKLEDITIKLLDTYISNTVVNITEVISALKILYGNSVTGIDISNLGGAKNYKVLTLASEHNRLCLNKKLVLQQDNTIIVKEDVTVNFMNIEKSL